MELAVLGQECLGCSPVNFSWQISHYLWSSWATCCIDLRVLDNASSLLPTIQAVAFAYEPGSYRESCRLFYFVCNNWAGHKGSGGSCIVVHRAAACSPPLISLHVGYLKNTQHLSHAYAGLTPCHIFSFTTLSEFQLLTNLCNVQQPRAWSGHCPGKLPHNIVSSEMVGFGRVDDWMLAGWLHGRQPKYSNEFKLIQTSLN